MVQSTGWFGNGLGFLYVNAGNRHVVGSWELISADNRSVCALFPL